MRLSSFQSSPPGLHGELIGWPVLAGADEVSPEFVMRSRIVIGAVLLGASPSLVSARSTPGGAAAKPEKSIVVTGQRPTSQSSIDRKSYSVSHDLQSGSGSLADVLRDLPSVDVDAQGNVSLRGDQNVQILIDGKPSTSMNGANRAETIQQLPASSIDRIEIMTNPSAQYKPDGTSGLINIITKRIRKPGGSGTTQASLGTDGRFNLGVTGAYNEGRLSLNGGLALRRDVARRPFSDRRTRVDPVTGESIESSQDSLFLSKRLSRIATAGVDYNLSPADRLSAALSYNLRTGHPQISEHDRIRDGAGGTITDFRRTGVGSERETNSEGSLTYRHTFSQEGHEFSVEVRRSESAETQHRLYTSVYQTPSGPASVADENPHADEIERELSADYSLPNAAGGKLQLGYDLDRNDDLYDHRGGSVDPASGTVTPDPSLTNRFVYDRTIHALYGTLEHPLGKKLDAIFGLRLEDTVLHTNQVTSGLTGRTSYFRAYPTVHLQYDLSDSDILRLSYSHRVARPEPEDLNPYPEFQDPQNVRAGNPHLLPQETHSLEAGYEHDRRGTSLALTLYLRKNYNEFTQVSRFISPTVLLTTEENLGRSTAAGVELTASGKVSPALSYNLSGNAFYNQIDASNLGLVGKRSAFTWTMKGSVDYHATPKDLIQVSAGYRGRRLTPQGYRLPSVVLNLGYRHQIRNDLAAVISVADVLDSEGDRTVIDTPLLHDVRSRRRSSRTASLGLSWDFGGAKKAKEPQFDYATDNGSGSSKWGGAGSGFLWSGTTEARFRGGRNQQRAQNKGVASLVWGF
jgi:outer membrane receptor protein involved in Fe transport